MLDWLDRLNPFVLVTLGAAAAMATGAVLGYVFGFFGEDGRKAREQELECLAGPSA